ncbi:DUF1002 domain-containing protein [Caproiciproducens sp. MSJ-32]|uniref:DUF1002 domain-containing protein n=1 Tax=Caproiciproducens sp. MSJ-32 TaxID=2841527 RepID=UPI001C0F50B8|nr:DUF1002 domain-containing protein [Caproiciproducens sp. MSJ-32]MBU5454229.1 DUF1002 domain-containing protein [Caproiciproducens sp. MSJ-32]
MKKNFLKFTAACALSISLFSVNVQAQNKERVTFGIDLTDAQEQELLKEFGVSEDQVTIDRITNEDIIEQLGLDPNDPSNYQGGCYSSSYVKLTDKGGIQVKAKNLTEVTALMLSNALVTSGITNAEVMASSPFPVTGTSALSGILKGFEGAKGEELSLKNKKTAQEEIEVTSELGEKIGYDEAAKVINDVKTQVLKETPKNNEEIAKIIDNVTKNYTIELTEEQKEEIKTLMSKINELDIDYDKVKDTLKNISNQIAEVLKESGKEIQESGFFQNLLTALGNFFSSIFDFLKKLLDK